MQENNQLHRARLYNFALIFKSLNPNVLTPVEDILRSMGCRVIYRNGPTTKLLFVVASDKGKSPEEIKIESSR